ncbi:MAG: cell division protein FtsA, partial [Sphaerochaetaceae bacterium]
PEALPGLDRSYINPRYSTVLGLLKSEAKKYKDVSGNPASGRREGKDSRQGGVGKKIKGFFRTLF